MELLCHRINLCLIVELPELSTVASPFTFQCPNFLTYYGISQHSILNLFLLLFRVSLFPLNFQIYWHKTLHYIPLFYSAECVRCSPQEDTCPEPPPQSGSSDVSKTFTDTDLFISNAGVFLFC